MQDHQALIQAPIQSRHLHALHHSYSRHSGNHIILLCFSSTTLTSCEAQSTVLCLRPYRQQEQNERLNMVAPHQDSLRAARQSASLYPQQIRGSFLSFLAAKVSTDMRTP